MLDESLRHRLESLNRGPIAPSMEPSLPSSITQRGAAPVPVRRVAKTSTVASAPSPLRPGLVKPIPGLVRRGEAVTNDLGEHWRVCIELEELWPGGEQLVEKRHARLMSTFAGDPADALCNFLQAFPNRALLLDLETCGFSGCALFLIGLLRSIDGQLVIELLLARNYAEESAVLASLWERVDAEGVVVTFNGKSFDWPMVVDRSRRHLLFRGQRMPQPTHLDLLHTARRRWRGELPDCKLQTLEQRICGRSRTGDIPGSQIPAAYQEYVRTGFEREMDAILLHNAIDLVTLLDLSMRLAS